jgi:hypothetical protein
MATVTVHSFVTYDGRTDQWIYHETKRTAENIEAIGCKIIPNTAKNVDETALDEYGVYDPRAA